MALIHVEDPGFKEVQVICAQTGDDVTVPLQSGLAKCRCEANRKEAFIGFDLEPAKLIWRQQAQQRLAQHHKEYMAQHFTVLECKTNQMIFEKNSVRFNVLKRDGEEWFGWIYEELQKRENFV